VLMADLKRVTAEAGFQAPQTLLASGNVLFGTDSPSDEAARTLEAAIGEKLGVPTDVVVRDHGELSAVLAANPFPEPARTKPNWLLVMFLNGEPQADIAVLQNVCVAGEEVEAGPGCLYIWYPNAVGVSKLSNTVIERRLKVRGTARNWNTVGKLEALLAGARDQVNQG